MSECPTLSIGLPAMRNNCAAILIFFCLGLGQLAVAAGPGPDLVISNVTTIDVVTGEAARQSVVVRGGRIEAVVSADASIADARETIDGTAHFLIPGLWDMHVHIVYEARLTAQMPSLFLDYGITSVRDTGALLHKIQPEITRWQSMGAEAPDIFFSGPLLDGNLVVYDGNGRTEIGTRNESVETAAERIDALLQAGVDFIKIYELVSPVVFQTMVRVAREAGIPIAAHVPLSMLADEAGPSVNSMEHLRNIEIACADDADTLYETRTAMLASPDEKTGYELRSHLQSSQRTVALATADPDSSRCQRVIRALANTIQVPTLRLNTITQYSPLQRADWSTALLQLPDSVASDWQETARFYAGQTSELGDKMSAWSLGLVAAMQREGVPIGAGTDTPIGQAIPGYSLHTELERLVDAGLTPLQALHAATVTPAKFFNKDDEMGQIKAGMEADLVLLEKNPLLDIGHTRSIRAVISDGTRVR